MPSMAHPITPPHFSLVLASHSVLSCTRPHLGDLKDRVRGVEQSLV